MKVHCICHECGAAVALSGRRIVRHTRSGRFCGRIVCDGTNVTATDDAVHAWLTSEVTRAASIIASAAKTRADAEKARADTVARADEWERSASELHAWATKQIAKLGGTR